MIEIESLCKSFGEEGERVVALENIDLTVNDGDIFGIIGLSGAGKSTLVRCINLLERPDSGRVRIDGEDLTTLSRRELLLRRQKIGMIFQHFNLLEQRTVLGNVCFPLQIAGVSRREALERAHYLLQVVGLDNRADDYPAHLSGGQKQRVAIARALATEPRYLLCDEATSALDPTTTESILDLIHHINREMGVTVVVITHEMDVIERICNRVAVIDQSHIVECGDVSDVFTDPQSEIACRLILPKLARAQQSAAGRGIRLVFHGESSAEPVISRLVIDCHVPVNILFADTREIDGGTYGQMLLRLPDDAEAVSTVTDWLTHNGVTYKEE